VNPECQELEVLVSLRASGAELSAPEAARLERHLESCAACRRTLEEGRELLDLVRLPAPEAGEGLAMADLPSRTLATLRRTERRRGLARRVVAVAAGMAVAAGVALALLSPALFRSGPPAGAARSGQAVVAQASWQEPDMDTLWSESAVVDYTSSSSASSSMTDGLLAAVDAGDGNYY
jgi:anti-sigma factor RsiW